MEKQEALDEKHGLLPSPAVERVQQQSRSSWRTKLVLLLGIAACASQIAPFLHRHRHHGHPHHHKGHHGSIDTEKYALSVPTTKGAQRASESYTWQTHLAGTEADFETVATLKGQWEHLLGLPKSGKHSHVYESGSQESIKALKGGDKPPKRWQWNMEKPRVWIDKYYPMMTYPVSHSLKAFDSTGQAVYEAKLIEDALDKDKTSKKGRTSVPTFHGFSKNGTARGRLVYAGSGSKAEFDALAQTTNLTGTIALVTYGGVFRGLKVKAAAEAGAVGCIIYTDIIEDGEVTVTNGYKPYPDGPARQPSSVQRGSVQYLSFYAGDPLTPGTPAHKDAKRISRDDPNINVPSIPSLPISGEDALPLLQLLVGRGQKSPRPGAFDVEYWTGPSEAEIELVNHVDEKITPIWNAMAVIPGRIKDEVVWLGNHVDAWTFGSGDPNSGTASMHQVVKTLGVLLKKGWLPHRTILLSGWDAEEYGLIGSAEFGEDHTEWLREHIVSYVNVDVSVSGSNFGMGASPSLSDLFREAATKVADPDQKNRTLADKMDADGVGIDPLGSGSDFTTPLQYIGLASAHLGFSRSSKNRDPVYHYHSIYDSAHWMREFGDPTWERHVAAAKIINLAVLGLVDRPVVPLNISAYARQLHAYVSALPESSLDYSQLNAAIDEVVEASDALTADARRIEAELAKPCRRKGRNETWKQLRSINKRLRSFESGFIDQAGLPGRSWYKNLVVAPGRFLGYGATTLPGVAEALKLDHDEQQAAKEVDRLVQAFKRTAAMLRAD